MSFKIKENDTRPIYAAQLFDQFGTANQTPLNLTNAATVKAKMRLRGTTAVLKVNKNCTIVDAVNGKVELTFVATETDAPGVYDLEFEIAWSGGGIETVPNDSYLTVEVVDDLDP